MVGLDWTTGRVARAVLLSLIFTALVVVSLPWLGRFYTLFLEELIWRTGIPSGVGVITLDIGTLLSIPVPYFRLDAPWPDRWHWVVITATTVIALLASFLLPVRFLPARYFIRFVALIQSVSLVYFAFTDPPFLYPLPGYTGGMLSAGMAVLTLVPIVLGFAFYIFDHSVARHILLTLLLLAHLAILLPLQVMAHAVLSHTLSALVQPTMFFVFGLLVEVLVFVSFYGWAMSWPGELQERIARGEPA
jgi:hypothetical protein